MSRFFNVTAWMGQTLLGSPCSPTANRSNGQTRARAQALTP